MKTNNFPKKSTKLGKIIDRLCEGRERDCCDTFQKVHTIPHDCMNSPIVEEEETLQIGCTQLTIQEWKKVKIIGEFKEEDYYLPVNKGMKGSFFTSSLYFPHPSGFISIQSI